MELHTTPVAAGVFLSLIAVGAVCDVLTRRIPNGLVAALAAGGLLWMGLARGGTAVLLGLACGVGVVLLLWIPWSLGGIGGGDAKLAAGAAIWVGWEHLAAFLLAGALAGGGVAALAYLGSQRQARAQMRNNLLWAMLFRAWPSVPAAGAGRMSVPYGVAVLIGAIYIMVAPHLRWPT